MMRSHPDYLGPNDKYRDMRVAMANLLNELSKLTRDEFTKTMYFRPSKGVDLLHTSAWYAEACADALNGFGFGDDLYGMFEQLEHGCTSITNIIILLRMLDRNG